MPIAESISMKLLILFLSILLNTQLFGQALDAQGCRLPAQYQTSLTTPSHEKNCDLIDNHNEKPIIEENLSAFWGRDFIGVDLTQEFMSEQSDLHLTKVVSGEIVNLNDLPKENLSESLKQKREEGISVSDYHGTQVASIIHGKEPFGISSHSQLKEMDYFNEFGHDRDHSKTLEKIKKDNSYDLFQSSRSGGSDEHWKALAEKKKPVVITAGNYFPELSHKYKPQFAEKFILVGQLSPLGGTTSFSSRSPEVTISAPGRIYSYRRGESRLFNGTSAAQPVVSACLANAISFLPGLTNNEAKELIIKSAIPTINSSQNPQLSGAGTINCYKLARVAERLKDQWPNNRESIFSTPSIYDFSSEARELKDKASSLLLDDNLCSKRERLNLLRTAFLLNPRNNEVIESIIEIYKNSAFPGNANVYASIRGYKDQELNELIREHYSNYFGRDLVSLIGENFPQRLRAITKLSLDEDLNADKARDKFILTTFFANRLKRLNGRDRTEAINKAKSYIFSVDSRNVDDLVSLYTDHLNQPISNLKSYCKVEGIEQFSKNNKTPLENCVIITYKLNPDESVSLLTSIIKNSDENLENFMLNQIRWHRDKDLIFDALLKDDSLPIKKKERIKIRKEVIDLNLMPSSEVAPGRLLLVDLEYLKKNIQEKFGYYGQSKDQIDSAINELMQKYKKQPDQNYPVKDFLLEVAGIFSNSIDAHIRPALSYDFFRSTLPLTIRPILKEGSGEEIDFLALKPGTQSLLDSKYPYINKINGHPVEEILLKLKQVFPKQAPQNLAANLANYAVYPGLLSNLFDTTSSTMSVELRDLNGVTKAISLNPTSQFPRPIDPLRKSGSKVLNDSIGYLRIDSMRLDEEELSEIHQKMNEFKNTDALIIDIRGNGGGRRQIIQELMPYFMPDEEKYHVATRGLCRNHPDCDISSRYLFPIDSPHFNEEERAFLRKFQKENPIQVQYDKSMYQDEAFHLIRNSRNPQFHYNKEVIILMDHENFSAADVFLGAFKGREKITLMGETSGGGSAAGKTYKTPVLGLEYRIARMLSLQPQGITYDMNGISPDIAVERDMGFYLGKSDSVLEQAINRLKD